MGNDTAHIILRGGKSGTNYSQDDIEKTCKVLKDKELLARVMVDFSHANSQKKYKNQLKVGENIASQVKQGSERIFGVMIESHLKEGSQKVGPLDSLEYGVSITDACIGWEDTDYLVRTLAKSVKSRKN
jgi:3-deoxy-7-phosphoheptulonate synthase